MAVRIRLRLQGRTNRPFYRLVVTDSQNKRDGKYLEAIGWYNPIEQEDDKKIFVDAARAQHWIDLGAEVSESAESLIRKAAPSVTEKARQKAEEKKRKIVMKRRALKQAKSS
ncbi:MAG: rpsP [Chlamydiales bacterium]|jgi:small subunit ribosomal protein S16|nr:rpsP [Chlamydiales bacterium]